MLQTPPHLRGGMIDGTQDIDSVQVNAEVLPFHLHEDPEDLPSCSPALQARVRDRTGENNTDDLFPKEELSALFIFDYI